jgi:hypothetical protein
VAVKPDRRRRQPALGFAPIYFDVIDDGLADDFLNEDADHWLGGCDRPFGRISYGLYLLGQLVAVAVSASTPNESCGPYSRYEVVECARLSAHRDHRDQTRVALRCWRTLAGVDWSAAYGEHWPSITGYVSYANSRRHNGDLYRFDGWKKVAETKGSTGGGTWSRPRQSGEPKAVWAFELPDPIVAARRPLMIPLVT